VDPTKDDGEITPPTGSQWLSINITVSPTTVGAKGVILAEQGAPDGAGADVFSYISAKSNLSVRLAGQVFRSLDGTDLGLAPASADADLGSLDAQLPQYFLDDAFVTSRLRPDPFVFFSVTDATKGAVPAGWWVDASGMSVPRSGAAIFITQWSMGGWSTPLVWCRPRDLGLTPGDDIDALAIDGTYAPKAHILFSTTPGSPTPMSSQLMFVARTTADFTTPVAYVEFGMPVAEDGAGTGTGVAGVCVEDPGPLQSATAGLVWGTPSAPALPFAVELWGGTYRTCIRPGGAGPRLSAVETWMSGERSMGGISAGEIAVCVIHFSKPSAWAFTFSSPPIARVVAATDGDPHRIRLDTSALPPFVGIQAWFLWGSLGTTPGGAPDISLSDVYTIGL